MRPNHFVRAMQQKKQSSQQQQEPEQQQQQQENSTTSTHHHHHRSHSATSHHSSNRQHHASSSSSSNKTRNVQFDNDEQETMDNRQPLQRTTHSKSSSSHHRKSSSPPQLEDSDFIIGESNTINQARRKSILKQSRLPTTPPSNRMSDIEQTNTTTATGSHSSKKRKRSSSHTTTDVSEADGSSKQKKRTRLGAKNFCTRVSKDLSDFDQFKQLISLLEEHTRANYCAKHHFLSVIHDNVFKKLHKFVEEKLTEAYASVMTPNELNSSLKAKEHILLVLKQRLMNEEEQWMRVDKELDQCDEQSSQTLSDSLLLKSLDDDQSSNNNNTDKVHHDVSIMETNRVSQPPESPISKRMLDQMTRTIMDIDYLNMCTSEIAQLQNIANRQDKSLTNRLKSELHVTHSTSSSIKETIAHGSSSPGDSETMDTSEQMNLLYGFTDPKKLLQDMQNDTSTMEQ